MTSPAGMELPLLPDDQLVHALVAGLGSNTLNGIESSNTKYKYSLKYSVYYN